MKLGLQLKTAQQLTITPQLQQSIRLLQLSTAEVSQEAERLLAENVFLERVSGDEYGAGGESPPHSEGLSASEGAVSDEPSPVELSRQDEDWGEFPSNHAGSAQEDEDYFPEQAAGEATLREYLLEQLHLSPLCPRDQQLIGLLIDALDERGYLAQPLDEIVAMLPPELDVTLDDLETALVQLQHLDQPGIAARDLAECLSLQLRSLPPDTPGMALALEVVGQYLELLAAHDFTRLKRLLGCDDDALRMAQALILSLSPRPAAEFGLQSADFVIPDVIVEPLGTRWQVRLNPQAMPRLRFNQRYASLLQGHKDGTAHQFAEQMQEARWFVKCLQQRFDTILRVSQAIVGRQRSFFERGVVEMRPLVLREIADQLELHESTVSRVTTQKFMLTPRGIFELKYFFSSGVATSDGGTCSSTAIRALIKQLVDQEDRQHPLTDTRLAEVLGERGIKVARRTVAKYRESMNILPINLRKSF